LGEAAKPDAPGRPGAVAAGGARPAAAQGPAGAGRRAARAGRESSPNPGAPAAPEGAGARERPSGRARTANASAAVGTAAGAAGKSTVGRVANAASTIADPNATAGEKAKEAAFTGAEAAVTAVVSAAATPLAGKVAGQITGSAIRSRKVQMLIVGIILLPLLSVGGLVMATVTMMNQVGTLLIGIAEAEEREGGGDACAVLPGAGGGSGETATGLSAEQMANARIIIEVGLEKGVPPQGLVVAIATARQESRIENLDYGDRDSVGLFQQRPSQGWGTVEQIMDPRYSAGKFYDALLRVPGWEQMAVTVAAQRVQASGHPDAYAQWEQLARDVVAEITGSVVSGPAGGCGGAIANCVALPSNVEEGLTPDALNVARCTAAQFQIPAASILGRGSRAANPESDHATGKAVDFMVADYKSAAGVATGDQWAAWLQQYAGELGINYIIWNAQWWSAASPDKGWQPYKHPSGATDDNNMHLNHVHVSVHGNAGTGFGAGGDVVGGWAFPAKAGAVVTSSFGNRFHPVQGVWKPHNGTDFASSVGDPIYAAAGGTVKSVVRMHATAGNWVVIAHAGGVETGYMHMSRIDVATGQVVQPGQQIGAAGATGGVTGPHLHFEVKVNGLYTDPVPFLQQKGVY
jgi:murein DD-endopeptidase MepM/ murein hydrolase activator NlpD